MMRFHEEQLSKYQIKSQLNVACDSVPDCGPGSRWVTLGHADEQHHVWVQQELRP